MSSFSSSILSVSAAIDDGMIITGSKEYIYDKCVGCLHGYFGVAIGLNPKYGWYVQCCELDKCSPLYHSIQLSLDL